MPLQVSVQPEHLPDLCPDHPDVHLQMVHLVVDSTMTSVGPLCPACQAVCAFEVTAARAGRRERERNRRLSVAQERQVMAELGGRAQPASGALAGAKGDGRVLFKRRVELKFSFARSFSLTRELLDKIRGECWGPERPAVILDFKNRQTGGTEDRWAIVPYTDWKALVDEPADHR